MTNFGYETPGASSTNTAAVLGSVFTISENGVADSISFYGSSTSLTNVKLAIYKHSDSSLVGVTDEISMDSTEQWRTANFSAPKPSLVGGTAYVLVRFPASIARLFYSAGASNQGHYNTGQTYPNFPDPITFSHLNNKYSIYCTYTAAGPPAAGGILAQVI